MSGRLAEQGRGDASELERAKAVDELLRRAYHGPPGVAAPDSAPARAGRKLAARDRRVAARTRAATASSSKAAALPEDVPPGQPAATAGDEPGPPQQDSGEPIAKVIPLGIFNAHEEAKKRW